MTAELRLPAKMSAWVHPRRFKIARGGRGGGKSRTCAAVLVREGARRRIRWLCAREVQKSIDESVYRLMVDEIERQGLQAHYDVQARVIKGRYTGTAFTFTGLREHTKDSLKSYEDYDGVWVEEAHSVSAASWEILIPTFRRDAVDGRPGSEIWATYNRTLPTDPIDVMARYAEETKDPDFLIVEINGTDNYWFPEVLKREMERCRLQSPDLYRHIWLGEYRSEQGIIFKREWFQNRYKRIPEGVNLNRYMASDYAVTPDAGDSTEHGVFGMGSDGMLYGLDWWHGQDSPDVWIPSAFELAKRHSVLGWFEEKGVILRSVEPYIKLEMKKRRHYINRIPLASASSKADRALGFVAMASNGMVRFPETAWADRVIQQLCAFNGDPANIDDAVDVCSLIARGLEEVHAGRPNPAPKAKPPEPFTERWFEKMSRMDDESRKAAADRFRP